ncbi:hypothetical protein NDS46_31155 (plasmid) [Paenibacillus thiaminolyticus]|uniref:hypothetical protein n=1 Tax=Paenibacillus thiaminolyticus TaxID=49283 RepID=UPI0023307541|nr:hypothetical protein [Paenibacillus thiaminolyticus]WCF11417.1 hypothetical protein NDS46_31155 [Paenibacillus thiaminolyticus]
MKKAVIYSYQTRRRLEEPEVKKKIRIRWKRLFIVLTVIFIFLYGAISLIVNVAQAVPSWVNYYQEHTFKKTLAQYEQVEVVVQSGETAWGLQQELTPRMDVRELLYLASKLNPGINLGELQSGDRIILLKERA